MRQTRSFSIIVLGTLILCGSMAWLPLGPTTCFAEPAAPAPAHEKMTPTDAWHAVPLMTPGINIGNTLDNTAKWETGWGNPTITKEYVQALAKQGFKTVRLPVAWDTFADNGKITPEQFQRVSEVVNWITDAGMYCVVNIHWDNGWIDSDVRDRFPGTYHTFSPEAQQKFRSYWGQIARFFAGKNEKLIFEAFNEETSFDGEGSPEKAYAALTRANQLFIDTVRGTGGNNAQRLLIVPGYSTDITKTCSPLYKLPRDTVSGRLFVSVHYYTPAGFAILNEDASWSKVILTWGTPGDVAQLEQYFDEMKGFCTRNNVPAFIGEFSVCSNKDRASRVHWTKAVMSAAIDRKMVPVLWDTGDAISRREPYAPTDELTESLSVVKNTPARTR